MARTSLVICLIAFALIFTQSQAKDACKPEQIHLALSDRYTSNSDSNSSPIKAIFHTKEACEDAYILLKTSEGDLTIKATNVNYFTDKYDGTKYETYVHIFDFPPLSISETYHYTCFGDELGLVTPKGPFKFYVPNPNPDGKETTVVMFGDLDSTDEGKTTMHRLISMKDANFTKIAAYIHMGDMAYNLENKGGKRGDDYMKACQDFAASMPYMISPGNHEAFHNFSNVNMRFKMPLFAKTQNHYYSYNVGNMHFASINLDLVIENRELLPVMRDWLAKDLEEANQNRAERPWIIVYTHRPLYCSKNKDDCLNNAELFAEIEEVVTQQKVDLYVSGHVHMYERMFPIKKGSVAAFQQFKLGDPLHHIINPQAPVYVVQGVAGHSGDSEDARPYAPKSYSVKVDKTYSFLAVHSKNNTHLLVENMSSRDGTVLDHFYMIKGTGLGHLPYYVKNAGQNTDDYLGLSGKKLKKLLRGVYDVTY